VAYPLSVARKPTVNRLRGAASVSAGLHNPLRRWWTEGGATGTADAHANPNDLITQVLFPEQGVPDQCHLDYYHKVRGTLI